MDSPATKTILQVDAIEVGKLSGRYPTFDEDRCISSVSNCCVRFEAEALEDIHIALSDVAVGKKSFYEFVFGSHGNTEAVIRRAFQQPDLSVMFCGRVCSPTDFIAYWIVVKDNILAMGLGNTPGKQVLCKTTDVDLIPVQYLAFSSWNAPVKYRNVVFESAEAIDLATFEDPQTIVYDSPNGKDIIPPEARAQFEQDCERLKKRSARFGEQYQPLSIKKYLSSQEIRRLQRSGAVKTGFTTGFDVMTDDEKKKREARMARFNTTDTMEIEKPEQDFSMSAKVQKERQDAQPNVEERPDAIHVFSLDDSFNQVRTSDIFGYFNGYGPAYVEWINDSSCTVVFKDTFTVSRALLALSQEVEEEKVFQSDNETDAEAINIRKAGWRFGNPITAARNPSESWRLLLRTATAADFPGEKAPKQPRKNFRHTKRRRHRSDSNNPRKVQRMDTD